MAEVWSVVDERLGTWHALKVLLRASPQHEQRLRREGRAQSALRHRNLVPVRDVLDLDGRPALLMPLIAGPTLAGWIHGRTRQEPQAVALFRGIAEGVAYAHEKGFIHRDLKPTNVLLDVIDDEVVPRVSDFGLVLEPDSTLTADGGALGTPRYAALEQLEDAHRADVRADVFSLGVMLVEMLSGGLPFPQLGTEARAARRAPPDLVGVPARYVPILRRCLDVDPDARPDTVTELLDALPSARPGVLGGALVAFVRGHAPAAEYAPTWADDAAREVPLPRDTFVGRELELAALDEALADSRLVTVLGPAGTGKTRLVQEFAHRTADRWHAAVWVDAAECTDAEGFVRAVGSALRLPLGTRPIEQLGRALAARGPILLVLDNLEQLQGHVGGTLGAWLEGPGDFRVLVTSRIGLGLRAEQKVLLEPLDPAGAAELFVDRVRRADPGVEPDAEGVDAVVALLDRLPLALELAAPRVRVLGLSGLRARLRDRFRVLRSGGADRPVRQRTLEAAIAWSWDLLDPHQQSALTQLSLFEGPFRFEEAEAVVRLDGDEAPWVDEVLGSLVEHSLVSARRGPEGVRFSLLVSVRAFAEERLSDPSAVLRHARHYAGLLAPAAVECIDDRMAAALDNLVAATGRLVAFDRPGLQIACLDGLCAVLRSRGPATAALRILSGLSALRGPADIARRAHLGAFYAQIGRFDVAAETVSELVDSERAGQALFVMTRVRRARGDRDEAAELIDRALERLDEDPPTRVRAMIARTQYLHGAGRPQDAESFADETVAYARGLGSPALEGLAVESLARFSFLRGEMGRCSELLDEAARLLDAGGSGLGATSARLTAVRAKRYGWSEERLDAAIPGFRALVAVIERAGMEQRSCLGRADLAACLQDLGHRVEARASLEAVLATCRRQGWPVLEGFCLVLLAANHRLGGDLEQAERCATEGIATGNAAGPLGGVELARVELARGELQSARARLERARGLLELAGFRVALPTLLGTCVEVELAAGDVDAARAHMAELEQLLSAGVAAEIELRRALPALRARL